MGSILTMISTLSISVKLIVFPSSSISSSALVATERLKDSDRFSLRRFLLSFGNIFGGRISVAVSHPPHPALNMASTHVLIVYQDKDGSKMEDT